MLPYHLERFALIIRTLNTLYQDIKHIKESLDNTIYSEEQAKAVEMLFNEIKNKAEINFELIKNIKNKGFVGRKIPDK